MCSKLDKQKGFSLVEALLAMTILGIAATSVLAAFSGALVAGRTSQDYALTALMMDDLRSYLRSGMFSATELNRGTFTQYPNYQWEVLYTPTEIQDFYRVDMTISWQRGNTIQTVTMQTYHYDTSLAMQQELVAEQEEGEQEEANGS